MFVEKTSLQVEKSEWRPATGQVLIVDDDAAFRQLLIRRASRLNLTVAEAENGPAAIELLCASAFDVMLLDFIMPGMTGLEVLQEALRIDPDLLVVIITGSGTMEVAVDALRLGAFDFFTKPLESLKEFDAALFRALDHRRLQNENASLYAEIKRMAVMDSLTSLRNRRSMDRILAMEFERSRRYDHPLTMLMIDMDNLKTINDRLGHLAGDHALTTVATAIQQGIRKTDFAGRFGGDEFMVVLPGASCEVGQAASQRIIDQINQVNSEDFLVTVSIGIAEIRPEFSTPSELLQVADGAMYQAKKDGGNTSVTIDS
jgi:diguanylate cyclase (GGDEF)-like protein